MKKTLNIIAVLLLVMVTLVTFGCKEMGKIGDLDKVDTWKSESLGGNSACLLDIKAVDNAIDWWFITDLKGVVFDSYTIQSEEGYAVVEKSAPIEKGSKIRIKFNIEKNQKLLLWTEQKGRTPKKTKDAEGNIVAAGKVDYRGKIIASTSQGYEIKDGGYTEEINPVGILELTCDETRKTNNDTNLNKGSWSGDYSISELWPLSQNEGTPEWTATEGLKFIFEEGDYIGEGETRKVIFPAGKLVVALKQPNILTEEERELQPTFKGDEPWYESTKEIATNGELHDNFWWCIDIEFPAHDITPVTSNSCNKRFLLSTGSLYEKSVLGATYLINDSDIVYGGYDK